MITLVVRILWRNRLALQQALNRLKGFLETVSPIFLFMGVIMQISLSLTYKDVNAAQPYRYYGPRQRMRPKRPKRPAITRLQQLRRRLRNIRSKILRRMDDVTLRMGDPAKYVKKMAEARHMKNEYNMLVRQVNAATRRHRAFMRKSK